MSETDNMNSVQDDATRRELQRFKRELIDRLVHDVRGPLAVVLTGLKELARTRAPLDAYDRRLLQLSTSSLDAALCIMQDLRDLGMLEGDAGNVHTATHVVGPLLAQAAEQPADTTSFRCTLDGDTDAQIQVDAELFVQATRILFRLVRAMGPPAVRVTVRTDKGCCDIAFTWTGHSFTRDSLQGLFTSEGVFPRTAGLSPLSLVLARRILETLGGGVRAVNDDDTEGEAAGACLICTVPLQSS